MKCNKIVSGLQSLAQLEAMSRFIAETSKEEEADAPSEHEHCGEQMVVVAEAASGTQTPAGLQQVPRDLLARARERARERARHRAVSRCIS